MNFKLTFHMRESCSNLALNNTWFNRMNWRIQWVFAYIQNEILIESKLNGSK